MKLLLQLLLLSLLNVVYFHPVLSQCTDTFIRKFRKATNKYRGLHGVPPLQYNDSITVYAQEWADQQLVYGEMTHRVPNDFSENIYHHYNETQSEEGPISDGELVRETMNLWYFKEEKLYREAGFYEQEPPSFDPKWAHFTTMVWKASTTFGVGCATSKDKSSVFVVANYYPKGNVVGEFTENVPRPIPQSDC